MSNLPTPVFPMGVDDPIAQDANFKAQSKAYVAYVDAQVRALERFLVIPELVPVAGNVAVSNAQLESQSLFFTGAPAAGFTATLPTTLGVPFYRFYLNGTGQSVSLVASTGATVAIVANSAAWIVFDGVNLYALSASSGGGGGGGGSGYPSLPASTGYFALSVSPGPIFAWVPLTSDIVGGGFTPVLTLASGGTGPFELGDTWTPTFNASPATNAGTLSSATIQDNQGNSVAVSQANPINAPASTHHYSLVVPGNVNVTLTETQASPVDTKTTGAITGPFQERFGYGVGPPGATGVTASGNNWNLVGVSGTLTGVLVANAVGWTPVIDVPAGQKIYRLVSHTGTPHAWQDAANGNFTFGFNGATGGVPLTISVTNQHTVTGISMDLYESTDLLTGSFEPKAVS